MLTRREFIKKGGVLAGVGMIGAVIPHRVAQRQEAEIAHPLSARPFMDNVMQPFADGMMDGIAKGIRPGRDTYQLLVQGPYRPSAKHKRTVWTVDWQFLMCNGANRFPKAGDNIYLNDAPFFGIIVDE